MPFADDQRWQHRHTVPHRAGQIRQHFDLFDFDFRMLAPQTRHQTIRRNAARADERFVVNDLHGVNSGTTCWARIAGEICPVHSNRTLPLRSITYVLGSPFDPIKRETVPLGS